MMSDVWCMIYVYTGAIKFSTSLHLWQWLRKNLMKSGHLLAVPVHIERQMRFNNSLKVSKCECRLKKSWKSSSSSQSPLAVDSPEGNTIKRRPGSTIREAGICNVTMKMSRQIPLALSDSKEIRLENINSHHRENWKEWFFWLLAPYSWHRRKLSL